MIILLIIISIIAICISIFLFFNKKKIDTVTIEKNKELKEEQTYLNISIEHLKQDICNLTEEFDRAKGTLDRYKDSLEDNKLTIEKEYAGKIAGIKEDSTYEIAQIQGELDKWKQTLAASIAAKKREQEMLDNISFYCLDLSEDERTNIKRLTSLSKEFSPKFGRVLLMSVWSAIVRDKVKALINRVADKAVTGIYKITSLDTNEVYIGQAVDLSKRAYDHYKASLGIDTPVNNQLYNTMQKYGIDRFSWELLEECKKEELNEKESIYIELYDSYNNGMNKNSGVKK